MVGAELLDPGMFERPGAYQSRPTSRQSTHVLVARIPWPRSHESPRWFPEGSVGSLGVPWTFTFRYPYHGLWLGARQNASPGGGTVRIRDRGVEKYRWGAPWGWGWEERCNLS